MKTPLWKYTFSNKRIREWVEANVEGEVLNLFAGTTLLDCNEIRNDLRDDMPADYHMDALACVNYFTREESCTKFGTVLLDPPYSYRKSMTKYEGAVSSAFNQVKNVIPKILVRNGIVITFGYHSNVMGATRSFEQEHILLMSHGGAIHDTIGVIERRVT